MVDCEHWTWNKMKNKSFEKLGLLSISPNSTISRKNVNKITIFNTLRQAQQLLVTETYFNRRSSIISNEFSHWLIASVVVPSWYFNSIIGCRFAEKSIWTYSTSKAQLRVGLILFRLKTPVWDMSYKAERLCFILDLCNFSYGSVPKCSQVCSQVSS